MGKPSIETLSEDIKNIDRSIEYYQFACKMAKKDVEYYIDKVNCLVERKKQIVEKLKKLDINI